jgi:acyl-coenzyme A synthetase/AMP-(fatty) acid ligase/acyl carrier protein
MTVTPSDFDIASWFIDRFADLDPDKTAVCGDPAQISYGSLRNEVNRAANALNRCGCKAGDRVLIALHDSIEFISAFFGSTRLGAIAVPVNPAASVSEFRFYLSDCKPRIAVVGASTLSNFEQAMESERPELLVVADDKSVHTHLNWAECLRNESALCAFRLPAERNAFILYTSGSTDRSKAVVHSHKGMIAASINFGQGLLKLTPTDRTFSTSKLFFGYGLGNSMFLPLSVGASTILSASRTQLSSVADIVSRHRPTIFFAVPALYRALLDECERGLRIDLSSIRLLISAGEHLPYSTFSRFKNWFDREILDGIGSTEMLQTYISNRPGQGRLGSCGRLVPGYDALLLDDSQQPIGANQVGVLWVRGESAFVEYWNNPDSTRQKKKDGWVITGDRFLRDADGYFYFHGRQDDGIKIFGMWVFPTVIEAALYAIPEIERAVVIAKHLQPDERRLVAYITTKTGHSIGISDVRAQLRQTFPEHMIPTSIISMDALPELPNGKVDRQKLELMSQPKSSGNAIESVEYASIEAQLAAILAELLDCDAVRKDVNFLDLGCDSIIAMRYLNRIAIAFTVELPIDSLFQQDSTIENTASIIYDTLREIQKDATGD